jgi:hypothetical protein
MERNVARAWSALTDSAWDEVGPSLDRARAALERAQNGLEPQRDGDNGAF